MMTNNNFMFSYGDYGYNEDIKIVVDPHVYGIEPKTVNGFYSLLDETRDWCTAIKQHVTNEHNATRSFVEADDDMTRDELEAFIVNDHDITREEIKGYIDLKTNEVKGEITTSKVSIENKIAQVKSAVDTNTSKLTQIWNHIQGWHIEL